MTKKRRQLLTSGYRLAERGQCLNLGQALWLQCNFLARDMRAQIAPERTIWGMRYYVYIKGRDTHRAGHATRFYKLLGARAKRATQKDRFALK